MNKLRESPYMHSMVLNEIDGVNFNCLFLILPNKRDGK